MTTIDLDIAPVVVDLTRRDLIAPIRAVDLAVVGLGYVGLPLAQGATNAGLSVVGVDLSLRVINGLNAGASHVDDLSDEDVKHMRRKGFEATNDAAVLAGAD